MKTYQEMMEDTYSADYKLDVNGNKSKARRIAFDYGKDDKKEKEKDKKAEMDEGVIGAVAGGVLGAMAGPAGMAAGAYLGHKIQKGANKDDKKKVKKEEVELDEAKVTHADESSPGKGKALKDMSKSEHIDSMEHHEREMSIADKKGQSWNVRHHQMMAKVHRANAQGGSSHMYKEDIDKAEKAMANTKNKDEGIEAVKKHLKVDHAKATDLVNKVMKRAMNEKVEDMSMGEVIKDFQKSDAPQFKGKSKAKRRQMAIAAKLQSEETTMNEGSEERLQMIRKAAERVKKLQAKKQKQAERDAKRAMKGDKDLFGEEIEQLDELSPKTLKSYVRKNHDSMSGNPTERDPKKFEKRSKGLQAAGKRLAKHNPYALYDNHKDFDKAHKDIHSAVTKAKGMSDKKAAKSHVDAAMKKHAHVGAQDTASREQIHRHAGISEAVGTAAKYADRKGFMGGKYTHNDHAITMKGDKFQKWRDKQAAKRDAEHKAQDPKHAKAGYAKHMVDTNKAKKKAAARGVDASHLNWKHTNGVKRGKLPEEVEQIDELSKDTMTSYVGKAVNPKMGNTPSDSKMKKRTAGIAKAIKKLAKEQVEQIDELSRDTINSYKKKATSSAVSNMIGGQGSVKTMDKRIRGIKMADKKLDQKKLGEAAKDYNKDGKIDAHEKDHEKEMTTFKNFDKRLKKIEKDEKKEDMKEATNPPFDPPYKKVDKNAKPARNSDGSITSPMSKAKQLAKQAIKNAEKTVAQHKEGVEFDSDGTILEAKNKITFHQFMGATKKKKEKKGGDDMPLEQS